MDDTKYFEQAVTEYCLQHSKQVRVGELTMGEISTLLRRAQELKAADPTARLGKLRRELMHEAWPST